METNSSSEDSADYSRMIYEFLVATFSPGNTNAPAGPIFNGPVNFISNSTIENFNGVELKSKNRPNIEHLKQNPQIVLDAEECKPKPLLKMNDFDECIFDMEFASEIKCVLHAKMEHQTPRRKAAIICCAVEIGFLIKKPTFRAVMHEFGDIISKSYYSDCFKNGFYAEEKEPYLEEFKQMKEEFMRRKEEKDSEE